jgi:predicted metal-dependent HD superfamily phosphohydrolase
MDFLSDKVLGRPPSEYDHYNAAIRREYQWVPETTYREARQSAGIVSGAAGHLSGRMVS